MLPEKEVYLEIKKINIYFSVLDPVTILIDDTLLLQMEFDGVSNFNTVDTGYWILDILLTVHVMNKIFAKRLDFPFGCKLIGMKSKLCLLLHNGEFFPDIRSSKSK